MTKTEHETLMSCCGAMRVNVFNYPTVAEVGYTPDGKRFTAWALERTEICEKNAFVGRYALKDLLWKVEE